MVRFNSLILGIIHCLVCVLKRDVFEAGSISFLRQKKITNLCVRQPDVLIAIMKVPSEITSLQTCFDPIWSSSGQ